MSMYPGHRAMGNVPPAGLARISELCEQIRSEFDTQLRQTDGYEHQIQSQIQEMQLIREKVYAMEQTHVDLKSKYEAEISMLRRQLEGRGPPPPNGMNGPPQHSGPSQPPPSLNMGNSNVFATIMSGQGGQGAGLAPPPAPPQDHQPHQMPPAPAGLQGPPPPPPPPSQQPSYQQQYSQGPMPGFPPQPPQSTASPGPNKRGGMGRPPGTGGPATPQINTPIPYPGPGQSPQVPAHPTPDHARGQHVPPPPSGRAPAPVMQAHFGTGPGDIDLDSIPPGFKKQRDDWYAYFNERVERVLDVDLVHTLQHESVVCCVRFSHDGQYVATGCNRAAQIFDVVSGQRVCILQDEQNDMQGDLYIRSVCFSPDGRFLATGAEDKLIRMWDIASKTIRHTFAGHDQDIYSLDFSRDGRIIASGSGDRTVRLWDTDKGINLSTFSIEDGVTTVAISPDCKLVAAGSLDKSVRVYDIQANYLIERLEGPDGHKDSVYSVAFSPSGHELVSGSLDKTIKMWELGNARNIQGSGHKGAGRCIKTFEGHKDFVLSVALTPNGEWVLSGSKDRGVQFWDPRTGLTQLMLQGHKNSVISVAPSPKGHYFATGSGDMRARIWSYTRIREV